MVERGPWPGGGSAKEHGRRVAVIGAGAWGTTLASLLTATSDVRLWAREPEVADEIRRERRNTAFLPGFALPPRLWAADSLEAAVAGADLVAMAVPAQHLRAVAVEAAGFLSSDALVVNLAKGIELTTAKRMTEVLAECLPGHDPSRLGVLTGPNLAAEVMAGQPGALVVAMPTMGAAACVQTMFARTALRAYTSTDVVGCEVGGAVKNVMALAAGMVDGLGLGWNTKAALICRSLAEMARVGTALGGDPLTFLGLSGNGDLVATSCSPHSRNRTVGEALGQGRTLADAVAGRRSVAEGVATTPALLRLAAGIGVDVPITAQVAAVLGGRTNPAAAIDVLLQRPQVPELHDLARSA
jgi:glycerol-3-phosphate dehydrogenase (NAD(P)+)